LNGTYRTSAFRIVEREKNTFRMMLVNLQSGNLVRYVTLHYPFWILEALAGLVMGRAWVSAAYARGFLTAMAQLPQTLARRRAVQHARKVPDAPILAKWSRRYEKLHFIRRVGLPKSA
jgi:NAD-dependent oxidoreductase involved in siderophore biosynthesis